MNCPYCNEETTKEEAFDGKLRISEDAKLAHITCIEHQKEEAEE